MYMNKTKLAEHFGIGRRTVYRYLEEIEQESERYGDETYAGNQVNVGVFLDYMKNRQALKNKNTRKLVPEYSGEGRR